MIYNSQKIRYPRHQAAVLAIQRNGAITSTVQTILELERVTKKYGEGPLATPALLDVSLKFEKGDFVAIAGPSGSGKTTLLNLIGCLDTPTEGRIFLDGEDLSTLSARNLATLRLRDIGFIFQSYNLIPVLTAKENVEIALSLRGDRNAGLKAQKILEEVGLAGFENRMPEELSGGQQQRVAIARALVKKPLIVLADEPTANLDSRTARDIIELMLRLNRTYETTFIFSTHDRMVMEQARRIILIRDGKIQHDS